ncbi:MAG: glycosyltransferase N-terminal domain-containing protein [Acidobacteriota bacterium]|nr:glycosyltransferase N-terminal domain-containing protein [Acidobacteriota bacterium]
MPETLSGEALLATWRLLATGAAAGARVGLSGLRLVGRAEACRALDERLALDLPGKLPPGALWLHGASVGEIRSMGRLADALADDGPLLLTSTTRSGRAAAEQGGHRARLGPWDAPGPLRRFLDAIRPRLHLVVETELWPLRLEALHQRSIPAMLVAARLSPERWKQYWRWRALYRRVLGRFERIFPASEEDRRRLLDLGVAGERLGPTGQLKWDAAPAPPPPGGAASVATLLGVDGGRPWIVLGSVHPGECAALAGGLDRLEADGSAVGILVAPRHPRRFDAVAAEIEAIAPAGGLARLSAGVPPRKARWVLVDRLGLLPRLYPLARACFVGGTLVPVGGHSPLEAAAAGCPQVVGPYDSHQRVLTEPLEQAGALVRAADGDAVVRALERWIRDDAARRQASGAAQRVVAEQRGFSATVLQAIGERLR